MVHSKKSFSKLLSLICAFAVVASTLGSVSLLAGAQIPEWQDVSGGSFLEGSEISGDIGRVIYDRATNTFTSGGKTATLYINMLDEAGNAAEFNPAKESKLAYSFDVSGGAVYVSPVNPEIYGYAVGNAFIDAVRAKAGLEYTEDKNLPSGHYEGALTLDEIAWGDGMTTKSAMLRIFGGATLKINKMQFESDLFEYPEIADSSFTAKYTVNAPAGITADVEAGTITSGNAWGTAYLDVYKPNSEERNRISYGQGALFYYDFTVERVEHSDGEGIGCNNPAYHGRARIEPAPWIEGKSNAIANKLMEGIVANSGAWYVEGKIPAGDYKGVVDLSDVWTEGTSDCIGIAVGEYTKVTVREMKLVNKVTEKEILDYTASYNVTGDVGKITSDTSGRIFTTGEKYSFVKITAANQILPNGGKLYYNFKIEMTEHTPNDAAHSYHGRASFEIENPNLSAEESAALNSALMSGIAANAGTNVWENTLGTGEYQGVADLSEYWSAGALATGMKVNLNEFTRVTVYEWKIVKDNEVVSGDVNGDGEINAADFVNLRKYLLDVSSETVEEYADVNKDGNVNIADLVSLKKKLADVSAYDIDTPSLDEVVIPQGFSIAPIEAGDPDFVPGTLYNGRKLEVTNSATKPTVGMWVWDCRMINEFSPDTADKESNIDYWIDMLVQNGVSEIYLGSLQWYKDLPTQLAEGGVLQEGYVSEMQLRGFVKKCSKYGIRVAMLTTLTAGDSPADDEAFREIARNDDQSQEYKLTKEWVRRIADFNSRANDESEQIYGLHIDLEVAWETGGKGLDANMQDFADYLIRIYKYCNYYNVELAFDINAFYEESWTARDEKGNEVCILDILTKNCDQLVLMSYRRYAFEQYDCAELELYYGAENGCQIILGSETGYIAEGDISYYPYGADYMILQQQNLVYMLANSGCEAYGIAFHHAITFHDLMTK